MKKIILLIILFLGFLGQCLAQVNSKHVRVKGHTRKDGTYVQPYYRTAPNSTNRDNFSTIGNRNPYTGKAGYIKPDNNYKYRNSTNESTPTSKTYYYPIPTKTPNKTYTNPQPTKKSYNNTQSTTISNKNITPDDETRNTLRITDNGVQQKWITKRLNKLAKPSLRKDKNYNLKVRSFSHRQERLAKRNKNIRLYQLSDGWYDVNFATSVDIRNKIKNVLIKRQILIKNGKAIKYLGAENMIFDIGEIFLGENNYKMKIVYPDKEVSKVYGDILLYSTKPLKRAPDYVYPKVVYFYTSGNNNGGPISVTLESSTRTYWGGNMDKYWNTEPDCSTEQDILKFYLPNGKYSYHAENNNGLWKSDFIIDRDCLGIKL